MVQVKVPVPHREIGDLTGYIENLLGESNLFPDDRKLEVFSAIAMAGKYNPRSYVDSFGYKVFP